MADLFLTGWTWILKGSPGRSLRSFICLVEWPLFFEVRNFFAPNPGICEIPGENTLNIFIFESVQIYSVLNDLKS